MRISDFDRHVQATDRVAKNGNKDWLDIAIYGLNAEIGSVVAAVKKNLLSPDATEAWTAKTDEIVEELGDVIWYGFSLARAANPSRPVNIFKHDIAKLKKEIEGADDRALLIRNNLDSTKREDFLAAASTYPKNTKRMEFESYQQIAFLTARTKGRQLVEVCLAVLWQLGAELFRHTLPPMERQLNQSIVDRPINDILGEIAWHVAALASVFNLKLSDIAKNNIEKVSLRFDRTTRTPLHDEERATSEQFPRRFEVSIVSIDERRSRMYLNGRQLGNDLTDNAYEDDGYRYHDILHLANVAKLGWSPVLRGLMHLKRRGDAKIDEVEDGARAQIVEEAVIKSIHSEGARIARLSGPTKPGEIRLFTRGEDITFGFLKFIRSLVTDLEVHKNRYWEWEDAILAGHKILRDLHQEGQGTVVIDLENRTIHLTPEVCVDLVGKVAGIGSAHFERRPDQTKIPEAAMSLSTPDLVVSDATRLLTQKRAVLSSLGNHDPSEQDLTELQITELKQGRISVKATGAIQRQMWARKVIAFKTTITTSASGGHYCTAIAVSDD